MTPPGGGDNRSTRSPKRDPAPADQSGKPAGTEHFFATCPRGLEAALATELTALGARDTRATDGGVAFDGKRSLVYVVNLWSRMASRVLWQVGFSRYREQQDVYDAALRINWPQWFAVRNTLRVNVTAIRSPLTSIDFITLKIKDAVCDRFRSDDGERPNIDTANPDVRVHAFLTSERARSISIHRAKRSSSDAIGRCPAKRRCARTSQQDCCDSLGGRPRFHSSTRFAEAEQS